MNVPAIPPVSGSQPRPLWSVMIPTYNRGGDWLRQTLTSVLEQAPGPNSMQIEVLDNASTQGHAEALVREVGGGRVDFFRHPKNVGMAGNWNECIRRARGHLVHILHDDDWIAPNFYTTLGSLATAHADCALFACRAFFVKENGELGELYRTVSSLESSSRDASAFYYENPLLAPGVVVRRSFYERHGGFVSELGYTADWEMWVRAISREGGCWVNQPLAFYRYSEQSGTAEMMRRADHLRGILRTANYFSGLPGFDSEKLRRVVLTRAAEQMEVFAQMGDAEGHRHNLALWEELATPTEKILHHYDRFQRRVKQQLERVLRRLERS